MKKTIRKIIGSALALTMSISGVLFSNVYAAGITERVGAWKESMYCEWLPVEGAARYQAYIISSDGKENLLDDELIRQYDTYIRADAVGLSAGNYKMRIVAENADGTQIASVDTETLTVESYKRDGFAFANGSASGGYNNDGTPESGALIFYITNENKDSVTCDIVTNSKGGTTACTGVGEIIKAMEKGYETRPFIFRFIGQVEVPASEQKLNQLDIKRAGNITFEGIGSDAVAKFGFNLVEAKDIEIRNLGFKDMTTKDEDAVTIKDESKNIWIHNLDVFYGGQGSDADQAKGDGSVDLKGASTHITVADNHYWDFGKVNLCGLNESKDYYVTYARNWFDHSDSRHPRIRRASVHIFNNFYDGVSKYGVGMTSGGSAFVEANYFRNTKYPSLISLQGSDLAGGGTFSGEDGGITKLYNNIMAGTYTFIEGITEEKDGTKNYDNQADGYTVKTREETLPDTLKCAVGATSYNNFDTTMELGVSATDILAPENVPSYVMANAGRCANGDFTFAFNNIVDDESYDVNPELVKALSAYTDKIVAIGGTVASNTNPSAAASSITGVDGNTVIQNRDSDRQAYAATLPTATEEEGNKATGGGGGVSSVDLKLETSDLSKGTFSSNILGVGTNGAFDILANSSKTVSVDSSKGIQLGGAGNAEYRAVRVTTEKPGTLYISANSTGSDTRTLNVDDANTSENIGSVSAPSGGTVKLDHAGSFVIYSTNKGINVTKVQVVYDKAVLGDANGDGTIDAKDASVILQFAATTDTPSEEFLSACDVNKDGTVDSKDASLVLQYSSGVIEGFGNED
ncbi:MAG: hypothetical protein IJS61_09520 [Firmicutes bacterium]|nr:hypothetical protein [Bacillota bacterium]